MSGASDGFITAFRESRGAGRAEGSQMAVPRDPRLGTLTLEGDQATLHFERRLRHPPDVVWAAITEPEQLSLWYLTTAKSDRRPGGSIDYVSGPNRFHVTGRILTWDPPRVFEHEWNVEPRNELPHGEKSVLRYELVPDGDRTILRVTHRRLNRGTARGFISGLHAFLDRLEEQLDGRPLSDWQRGLEAIRPTYLENDPARRAQSSSSSRSTLQ